MVHLIKHHIPLHWLQEGSRYPSRSLSQDYKPTLNPENPTVSSLVADGAALSNTALLESLIL